MSPFRLSWSERLLQLAGKSLISDCVTRWNSSLYMVNRMIELREHLSVVLDEQEWQDLTDAEWSKLETFVSLTKPFQEHTDLLQADGNTLSNLIPAILSTYSIVNSTYYTYYLCWKMLYLILKHLFRVIS